MSVQPTHTNQLYLFFCGDRCLNPRPCIYYELFIPIELNSRGQTNYTLIQRQNIKTSKIKKWSIKMYKIKM